MLGYSDVKTDRWIYFFVKNEPIQHVLAQRVSKIGHWRVALKPFDFDQDECSVTGANGFEVYPKMSTFDDEDNLLIGNLPAILLYRSDHCIVFCIVPRHGLRVALGIL